MLSKRIITAIIASVYLIFAINLGGWFFNISVILCALLSLYEYYSAFLFKGIKIIKIGYIFALILLILLIFDLNNFIVICLILFIFIYYMIFAFNKSIDIFAIMVSYSGLIYPVLPFGILIKLRFSPYNESIVYLWLILILTWSADTFAFFAGRAFGKHKLCPDISPKKTVEGSIGGGAGAIIMGFFSGIVINNIFNFDIVWYNYLIIGLLCGIFGQIGDLIASKIKRYCKIKDYGKLFPGHGGVLDRFDSILVSCVVVYFYLIITVI